jgi:endonuclease/exonuclease/phosphatase family metal-dependent hydrolase
MYRFDFPLALLILAGYLTESHPARGAAEPIELSVVTFNVLVDLGSQPGVPRWADRRELCVQVLRQSNADLIGLQEPLPAQVDYLLSELPGYDAVAYKGYPDATLLFKREVFEKLDHGHWWLSPTPERVSTGFGNTLPRLVVWAKLRHRAGGRDLFVFNTHFDNSMPSQVRMAELCQQQLAKFAQQKLPMLFMGDFNTTQTRGDYPKLISGGWQDAYAVSPQASPGGRDDNVPTMYEGSGRIDHIFYHGDSWRPVAWERLESPDEKKPLSDHYPVLARFKLN